MSLIHSKRPAAFVKNLKTELHAGKPRAQALAIAYSEKRRAEHKKAEGGRAELEDHEDMYAKGGEAGSHALNHAYNYDAQKDMKGVHEVLPRYQGEGKMTYGESTVNPAWKGTGEGAKKRHHEVLNEIRSMPNPKLKGMADGGSVSDAPWWSAQGSSIAQGIANAGKHAEGGEIEPEHEMSMEDMAADELCEALESKDKSRIVSSMKALIASCMNEDFND